MACQGSFLKEEWPNDAIFYHATPHVNLWRAPLMFYNFLRWLTAPNFAVMPVHDIICMECCIRKKHRAQESLITVTSHSYLDMLEHYAVPQLPWDAWLQQDGAPPHFGNIVRQFLNERFPNKWIGRGSFLAWPPRSPDLTCSCSTCVEQLMVLTLKLTRWQKNFEICTAWLWDHFPCVINIFPFLNFSFFFHTIVGHPVF
jgi:hypothetical protein